MRGAITPMIQQIARDKIGRDISQAELRLIPYVQYVMLNGQHLDPRKINQEEREILSKWRKAGYVEGGASGMSISKDFYDFMCEILWEGYVVGGATDAWVAVNKAAKKGVYIGAEPKLGAEGHTERDEHWGSD